VKTKANQTQILVVDDEEIDRRTVADALKAEGYSVFEAESYSDAMAVFDLHRDAVQLLIADVSLPDGNGCALAIAVHRQKPDLRVLFISFHVGSEICKRYGLDVSDLHFLKKPLIASELRERVRKVLTSRQKFPRLIGPKTSTASGRIP
jgi:DNA-binding response OmpR family regulator